MTVTPRYIYQLHVQVQDASPAVWRRLHVADSTTMAQLHRIVQAAMGWHHARQYVFELANQRYGQPNPDLAEDPTMDARRYTLGQLLQTTPVPIRYTCVQGREWQHRIKVEAVVPGKEVPHPVPHCSAGLHACPAGSTSDTGPRGDFDLLAAQQRVRALLAPVRKAPTAPLAKAS